MSKLKDLWQRAVAGEDGAESGASGESGEAYATEPEYFGRYRVDGVLGRGGYGTVYAGFDEHLERPIAIKAAHQSKQDSPERDEAFLEEARHLAALRHPGIVTVFDAGIENDIRYLVSDLLKGVNVHKWLKQHRPHWRESVAIIAAVADALAYAHNQGTVHRDVKPSNVILTKGYVPMLVDFGLAFTEDDPSSLKPGIRVGTPAYMSPEQVRGAAHLTDGRTDIFSLGIMFYRMLTGRLPFRAKENARIYQLILKTAPRPIYSLAPDVPEDIARICMMALEKQPEDRFNNAAEFARQLRAAEKRHPRVDDEPEPTDGEGPGQDSTGGADNELPSVYPGRPILVAFDLCDPSNTPQAFESGFEAHWLGEFNNCHRSGAEAQEFQALRTLITWYQARADHQRALTMEREMLALAKRTAAVTHLAHAHFALGLTFTWTGDWVAGRGHLEQTLRHLDDAQGDESEAGLVTLLRVPCLSQLADTLWYLGFPERSASRFSEVDRFARDVGDQATLARAIACNAAHHARHGAWNEVLAASARLLELAGEHQLTFWRAWGAIRHGHAVAMCDSPEEGLVQIADGMVNLRASGIEAAGSEALLLLAEVCARQGDVSRGLETIEEGLAFDTERGAQYSAELYRVRGHLLAAQQTDEAIAAYRKAIETARFQTARWSELKSTLAIARLLRAAGEHDEAHGLVNDIYEWFSEGFDTQELQQASRLLEEYAP